MRELTYFPLLESFPKTSGYGYRTDPITGAQGDFHRGVDYGAPSGAPVIAPFDGQVTTGYESGGAGNWCWVVSGGDMFKSFHHDSHAVSGGWVTAGTVIAYIGSTGSSTGSHAHFELWEGGTNLDPTGYLDRAPLYGGGSQIPGSEDVEMTEDDWTRMQGMVQGIVDVALANHYTGSRAVRAQGEHNCYELVIDEGRLARRLIPDVPQVQMLQYVDYFAGTGDGEIRDIVVPEHVQAFNLLPVVD
jgi:hypothetical protein